MAYRTHRKKDRHVAPVHGRGHARACDRAAARPVARFVAVRTVEKDGISPSSSASVRPRSRTSASRCAATSPVEGRAEEQAGGIPRHQGRGARSGGRDHGRSFRHRPVRRLSPVITIGKGFAGVMKRWNFRGPRGLSHGVSVSHRSHGSDRWPPGSRPHVQGQEDGPATWAWSG